jgi:polyribonucleotide nucleotidyltransferase
MAPTEIQRIMDHLDRQDGKINGIAMDVNTIVITIKDYGNIVTKASATATAIEKQIERCDNIQKGKLVRAIPWGNVKSGIITGLFVGTIMALVGFLIGRFLN